MYLFSILNLIRNTGILFLKLTESCFYYEMRLEHESYDIILGSTVDCNEGCPNLEKPNTNSYLAGNFALKTGHTGFYTEITV